MSGLWLMSGPTPHSSYAADVLPSLAIAGLGLGLAFVPVIGIAALITVATDRTTTALHSGARVAPTLLLSVRAAA